MIETIHDPLCSDWVFEPGAVTMSQESFDALRNGEPIVYETATATIGAVWKRKAEPGWYLFILDSNRIPRQLKIIIKDGTRHKN